MKHNTIFQGVATALATPMTSTGVDYEALGRLIDFQLESGINALVAVGTTGESATLTPAERNEIIRFTVERVNGRVPVIAGTGTNNTLHAIDYSVSAAQAGADALLVVTPYYNKATQNGLIAHFTAIADKVDKPIILYNVPSRTGCNLLPATVEKLAQAVPGCKASITPLEDGAALADAVRHCDILVSATRVGMKPLDGETLADPALFRADLVVADTVYNPRETRMIREARAAGCQAAVGGIGMLLWQGVAAFRLFTGKDMPAQEVLEKFFSYSYYQARAKGGFGLITIESTVEKDSELGGNFRIASYPTGKGQISEAIRSMIVRGLAPYLGSSRSG